jgi:PAS domain S-box-containing protein
MMPKMNGYELCRRIKSQESLAQLPVILLSSFSDPSDVLRALEAGADLFLPKQELESTLIEKVQGLIASCQKSKEHIVESVRILLVEDSPVQAERMRYLLTRKGYEVLVAQNGREALDTLKQDPVDLIISDIVMPEMDGYAFCRQVKQDRLLRKIPLLLLTSQTEKEAIIQGLEAGADAYVSKPEADDKLMDKISELMETSLSFSGEEDDEVQKIQFQGNAYEISLSRRRLLNFLIFTYELACQQNKAIQHAQLDLKRLNQHLEKRVAERTQELTSANEQLLIQKRAMDAADQGITITDPGTPDNPIVYANNKFSELTGYSRDETLGKNWRFLQGEDTDDDTKAVIRKAISEKKEFAGELVNYRKDGTPFWNAITITPVFSDSGRLLNYIGMQKDVTEEKRLREENRKNTRLLDATKQIFQETLFCEKESDVACKCLDLVVDLTGSQFGFVGEINPQGRFDTMAQSEMAWKQCRIPENNATRMIRNMEIRSFWGRVLKTGKPQIVNDPASDPDSTGVPKGHPAITCFIGAPLFHAGKVFGMIALANKKSGYGADDLEALQNLATAFVEALMRKRSEIRLKQQHLRMNLLNTITRSIGERLDPASIFSVVLERLESDFAIDFGSICLVEPQVEALAISSIGPGSLPMAGNLELVQGDLLPVKINGFKKCVEGETVYEPDTSRKDLPLLKRFSRCGLHSIVGTPLQVENEVLGVVLAARTQTNGFDSIDCAFLRQLSEHVALAVNNARLYGKLQASYDELRKTQKAIMDHERLKAMGQMASGLSHDINNALGPITLYTESLLEGKEKLSAKTKSYLKTIQIAATDISNTISRMREFYRKRDDNFELLSVNLNKLVHQAVELTKPRWKNMPQKNGVVIQVKTELQKDLMPVTASETDIRDALTNLIFNAVDAMPDGGVLTIITRQENARIVLEVADTGIGMNDEMRRCCLEPFYTSKGDRGTGLGLPMVYGVIQRHKGEIKIESETGQGTIVRILFPISETEVASIKTPASNLLPPLAILYIDDDALMRESLKEILEKDGHRVRVADSGQAGLEIFRTAITGSTPFDVVITDMGMPLMDGKEVARNIKIASSQTPVIMLTGWGAQISIDNALPKHVDRLVSKPPKGSELRRILIEVVRRDTVAQGGPNENP